MLKKSVTHILLVSFLAVMLTGCGSSGTTRVSAPAYTGSVTQKAAGKDGKGKKAAPPTEALLSEARSWIGTPYKYGGNDRGGVDCSGFVLQVYQRALDIPLPRSSREQYQYCRTVTKGSLIPGDLIFFATDKNKEKISHVGIFVGDNQMIHASTSKGVMISDITSAYYARNYAGSGVVERYHNMLGDKPAKKKKEKKKSTQSSQEGPVIHIDQSETPAGFTLTPVESLPERTAATPVTAKKDKKTSTTKKEKPVAPVTTTNTVTTVNTATTVNPTSVTTTEPTVEDARAAVLRSIKEKNL